MAAKQAIILAIALAATPAGAAPQVEIKAHTRLAIGKVKLKDHGQVEIAGQLVDKLTGDGLGGQSVAISVAGQSQTAVTDPDGAFHATLTAPRGPLQVGLAFAGARALDRADPLTATTDPSKQQLELAITKLADDPAGVQLKVAAFGDDGPAAVPIQLAIAPQSADAFRPLAHAVTANERFTLTRVEAGGAGLYRVRATFAGDDHTQEASREVLVELAADSATTMQLASARLAYEDDLVATGLVSDQDGAPVAQAAVTLTTADRRLAQGTTDAQGRYKLRVEAQVIGERELSVQVQADPRMSFVRPSSSPAAPVTIAAPQPVPVSYTVAAFALTGLAAAAFFLARTRPWRRLKLRLRPPAPPAEVASDDPGGDVVGGLVTAKPGIVSSLRRATDDGFTGAVRDSVRGRPIAGAAIRLRARDVGAPDMGAGERTREAVTGDDGAFAFEPLEHGEWAVEVSADGHVSERFSATVPHRGELRGARVDLVPVRERVFQLYRRAAEPVLPEPRLWGIWTPRQIVDHVRARRPTPALAELTDFVEEIYFSPRIAAEGVLAVASERVDRAIHERAGVR